MFITKKHISRRTVLRGMGVTMALPLLEAMVPARPASQRRPPATVRLACHRNGARVGGRDDVRPAEEPVVAGGGRAAFDLAPTSLAPLEPFRDYLTIVSNTDVRNAEAFDAAGNRRRSLPLERGLPDAGASEQTQGSDVRAGTSLDQLYAQQVRTGHADSVDAAVHRERGPGRRLLATATPASTPTRSAGRADAAAADDPRSARGVRSAVRRRARRPRSARRRRRRHAASSTGSRAQWRGCKSELGAADRRAARRLPRRRARDRAPHSEGRGVQQQRRAARDCRTRRSACPTRSKSTSS